ncbi:MAG TPA: E3 binding domain-containing protein, partial [Chloroflexota bacterium]
MPTKVIMPTLGLTMEQGTINQWLKREGDPVEKDEPIFVVETDKAAMEVGAPASGILKKILAPEGATVPVQQVIAWITQPGEELPDDLGGAPASAPRAAAASAATASDGTSATSPAPVAAVAAPGDRLKASPRARRLARELGVDLLEVQGSGPGGRIVEADVRRYVELRRGEEERVKASPVARKLAEELGVSLASVTGTGPGGRITREDVEAAARRAAAAASPPPAAPTPAPPVPAVGEVV